LPKLSEKYFEIVGKGGWPPISTLINNPSLGINGLHFVEFPQQMKKFMLNLALGEPLSLLQELPYLENPIKLDLLLASALDLCVHYLINGCMFNAVKVEIYWCQLFYDL